MVLKLMDFIRLSFFFWQLFIVGTYIADKKVGPHNACNLRVGL